MGLIVSMYKYIIGKFIKTPKCYIPLLDSIILNRAQYDLIKVQMQNIPDFVGSLYGDSPQQIYSFSETEMLQAISILAKRNYYVSVSGPDTRIYTITHSNVRRTNGECEFINEDEYDIIKKHLPHIAPFYGPLESLPPQQKYFFTPYEMGIVKKLLNRQ